MKKNDAASSILKLLQEEKKSYGQLLQLAEEQVETIVDENASRLEKIMAEKAEILKSTRDHENRIEQIITRLSRQELREVEQAAGGLQKEVTELLDRIIELEDASQTDLQARKFLVQDKILDLKQKRALLKGYGGSQRIKPKISKNV